jgi:hypothetical protein
MRTRHVAAIAVAVALMAPSSAAAGGFATVGLDPLPDGIGPGKPWQVRLTILQHGRTPLDGLVPEVIAKRGSVRKTFAARPAGRPGVYRARVVFPSAGTWHYVVDDGFTMTHTFPPVRVRAGGGGKTPVAAAGAGVPAAGEGGTIGIAADSASTGPATSPSDGSSDDGPDIALALALAAVAGLAAALGTAALRRRRPRPAPERG